MAEVNWGWGFESHKIEFNKKAAGNAAFLSRFAAHIQKQTEFQKSNQKRPKTAFFCILTGQWPVFLFANLLDQRLDLLRVGWQHAHSARQVFDALELRRARRRAAQGFFYHGGEFDGQRRLQHQHGHAGAQALARHFHAIGRVRVDDLAVALVHLANRCQPVGVHAFAAGPKLPFFLYQDGSYTFHLATAKELAANPDGFVMPGTIVTTIINFFLIAVAVYFAIVLPMNKVKERMAKQKAEEEANEVTDVELLTEIRDLLAKQKQA